MSRPGDDDFLSRWSRKKREAVKEDEAAPEPETPAAPVAEATDVPEKTDAEILEELGLPDPDTLSKGDDFTGFLKQAVPARLRNRALRRLWLTDPVLANLDELLDYGEDFTDAATVVENLQTAYQVGRGWLLPEEDEAAEPSGPDTTADEETPEPATPPDDAVIAEAPEPQAALTEAPAPDPAPSVEVGEPMEMVEDEPAPPRPRRMRFRFEDG